MPTTSYRAVFAALEVITSAAIDSASQDRKYGIATFGSGQVQFTGSALHDYRGERSADGILVQGIILAGPAVLDRAMEAIRSSAHAPPGVHSRRS